MKKFIVKTLAMAMATSLVLGVGMVASAAPAAEAIVVEKAKPTKPAKVKVEKVTVSTSGNLKVSFKKKVEWAKDAAITVVGEDGAEVSATLKNKTKTSVAVKTKGLVKGQKYTLKITGIKDKGTEEFSTASYSFVAKGIKTDAKISTVKVTGKNTVVVNFSSKVDYKDATVEVKDADGVAYEAKIVKKASGNVKVQIKGLTKGTKYTVVISGIKLKKEANYSTVTKTFVAK